MGSFQGNKHWRGESWEYEKAGVVNVEMRREIDIIKEKEVVNELKTMKFPLIVFNERSWLHKSMII